MEDNNKLVEKADIVIISNCIFDGINDNLKDGILAIKGNKILGIYKRDLLQDLISDNTKVYVYENKLVMPGFHDSHIHMAIGSLFTDETYCAELGNVHSLEECMNVLVEFGNKYKTNEIVVGGGFNNLNIPGGTSPDKNLIDNYIKDRPVIIMNWSFHTIYANTLAIKLSGILDIPGINGIERDKNGEPTGEFNDSAAFEMQDYATRVSKEQKKSSMKKLLHKMNMSGITSASEVFPSGRSDPYSIWKEIETDEELTARLTFYPPLLGYKKEEIEEYRNKYNSGMLLFSGLKALMDGVIIPHTAWMHEPYANAPHTSGEPAVDPDYMKNEILRAHSEGINVRIHTIGDKAVTYVLDCFEEANKKYGSIARRHCMEHVNYIKEMDYPRFKELGVAISTHPTALENYMTPDNPMLKILGEDRCKRTWPVKSFLDNGAIVGTGTDFSVVPFDPMLTMHAMCARCGKDGWPEGGWNPDQKISIYQALSIYTYGSAAVVNREKELGTLDKGKYADITVLDKNITKVSYDKLVGTKAMLTIVNGKVVYEQ